VKLTTEHLGARTHRTALYREVRRDVTD